MFKKKANNVSKVKAGEPLTFFINEETTMVEKVTKKQGILHYCCKDMEKACKNKLEDDDKPYLGGTQSLILNQEYYEDENKPKNGYMYNSRNLKIGCHTHKKIDDDSEYDINFKVFSFCPFCGTKINGYIEV